MTLFEQKKIQTDHHEWIDLADSDNFALKNMCNEMYLKYSAYADTDFLQKFKTNIHSAFWEMDLACTLLDSGKILSNTECGNKGPDICIYDEIIGKIWIEAICPTRGNTVDAVALCEEGNAFQIDSERISLRITRSILEKHDKHKNYLKNGNCKENEPYIIAINGCQLTPGPGLDDLTPRVVKCVFEGGNDLFIIKNETKKAIKREVEHKPFIEKLNGSHVYTAFFRSSDFSNISAIIYSDSSIWSRPAEIGGDYIIVINPFAKNPIDIDFFGFGTEYREINSSDHSLSIKSYRKIDYLYR